MEEEAARQSSYRLSMLSLSTSALTHLSGFRCYRIRADLAEMSEHPRLYWCCRLCRRRSTLYLSSNLSYSFRRNQ